MIDDISRKHTTPPPTTYNHVGSYDCYPLASLRHNLRRFRLTTMPRRFASPPPTRFTGIDLVRGGAAGTSRGKQHATLASMATNDEGGVTVMIEDEEAEDEITLYRKQVLLVDISSSSDEEQEEEEVEEGWISPQLPTASSSSLGAAKDADELRHQQEHGLPSVSSWPHSLLMWGQPTNQRGPWHHMGAAAGA